ncbi:MAG: hypothetical protein D6812_12200 [Deltaproteobacteria bacterium]|nr:MAG: hypothetical protein D6812_12200 [Deltaproteobacteria bacterium]
MDASKILADAATRERLRARLRAQSTWRQIDARTRHCPGCGHPLKLHAIEHPGRELGTDGQTVLHCPKCGNYNVVNRTLDEARPFGDSYVPGVHGSTRPLRSGYVARIGPDGRLKEVKPVGGA